jgi:hypothetical protein
MTGFKEGQLMPLKRKRKLPIIPIIIAAAIILILLAAVSFSPDQTVIETVLQ